jgi:xanthine dehydrogenase molybdenum-binding subunit
MRASHLLDRQSEPSRDEIERSLAPHICRCTGYTKIVDAIELAAGSLKRGQPLAELEHSAGVGGSLPRYDGEAFALGEHRYIDDMSMPGQLFELFSFSPTRALLCAHRHIGSRAALGVAIGLTAADVPGRGTSGLIYNDWPRSAMAVDKVRCVGDAVAFVIADTIEQAREAADAIEVDYEVLPPVTSPEEALDPSAPKVHKKGTLLSTSVVKRGDSDGALRDSAFVVEETFETQLIEHAFLEPESCIAHLLDDGRLQVYSQGQGVFDDRRQIASFLALEEDRINVTLVSNGGAFGGKEDLSIQGRPACWRF